MVGTAHPTEYGGPGPPDAMPNFPDEIEDWYENTGPHPDFVPADTRLWSIDACANVRFGFVPNEQGRMVPLSLRPCRAMDLRGTSMTTPGVETMQRAPTVNNFWNWWEPWDYLHPLYEWTFDELPEAGSDVELYFEANADLATQYKYGRVYVNGQRVGNVFEFNGVASPNRSEDTLVIPAAIWNDLVGEQADFQLWGTNAMLPVAVSRVRMQMTYTTPEVVHATFGNQEVCFQHRGYGVRVNARGKMVPVTFIQPVRDDSASPYDGWGARVIEGVFTTVRPDDPEAYGRPGRVVALFPFELPPNQESLFESHPVVCKYEDPIP